ncbi:DUF1295 domain-containing protein [Nocardioides sp. R-C-SC26]|uniref:DUF1295 domain-containing protein n=1 Tax=Nocardioides sp. R-C-SC26 TaxID=2870414 RepID=UPI001E58EA34|nr:DUF1295 domain-containing protein [Nocardioides sp. R-C-SC26]
MSKQQSLVRVTVAYVIAIGVGAAWFYAGPDTDHLWLDGLIADLLATLVIFGASRMHRNSSFYDAYWSVLPPLLALAWWFEAGRDGGDQGDPLRFALLMLVVWLWAIRLTGNWVYGFPGLHHEDWRYARLRDNAGRFELPVDLVAIHVIPTLQVFLGMIPVYIVATRPGEVGWLDVVAVTVGLGAVLLETVADVQMHRFVAEIKRTGAQGAVMDRGVWSWSRHPNYVGEFGLWVSLAIFGTAADAGAWWQWVGVLAMYAMFQGASIPLMEERSLARRPEYQQVIDRVARFLPRPPRART